MKSLKVIQVLFKIARIIALIAFILCIIGAAGCAIAIIVLSIMKDMVIVDGLTFAEYLASKGVEFGAVITYVIFGMVTCGFNIFLAKYSELFFLRELKQGTPFTKDMVKDMRKYGLVYIIVSLAATVVLVVAYGITAIFIKSLGKYDYSYHVGSIIYGLFFIILSLFCDYGAERDEELANNTPQEIDNKEE